MHLVERACNESDGEITLNDVLANLEHWPILVLVRESKPQAVMVVAIVQRGDGQRRLDCLLASGHDAYEWPEVDDQLDAFAREFGCSSIRIPRARKGWLKVLKHWDLRGYVLDREIR